MASSLSVVRISHSLGAFLPGRLSPDFEDSAARKGVGHCIMSGADDDESREFGEHMSTVGQDDLWQILEGKKGAHADTVNPDGQNEPQENPANGKPMDKKSMLAGLQKQRRRGFFGRWRGRAPTPSRSGAHLTAQSGNLMIIVCQVGAAAGPPAVGCPHATPPRYRLRQTKQPSHALWQS